MPTVISLDHNDQAFVMFMHLSEIKHLTKKLSKIKKISEKKAFTEALGSKKEEEKEAFGREMNYTMQLDANKEYNELVYRIEKRIRELWFLIRRILALAEDKKLMERNAEEAERFLQQQYDKNLEFLKQMVDKHLANFIASCNKLIDGFANQMKFHSMMVDGYKRIEAALTVLNEHVDQAIKESKVKLKEIDKQKLELKQLLQDRKIAQLKHDILSHLLDRKKEETERFKKANEDVADAIKEDLNEIGDALNFHNASYEISKSNKEKMDEFLKLAELKEKDAGEDFDQKLSEVTVGEMIKQEQKELHEIETMLLSGKGLENYSEEEQEKIKKIMRESEERIANITKEHKSLTTQYYKIDAEFDQHFGKAKGIDDDKLFEQETNTMNELSEQKSAVTSKIEVLKQDIISNRANFRQKLKSIVEKKQSEQNQTPSQQFTTVSPDNNTTVNAPQKNTLWNSIKSSLKEKYKDRMIYRGNNIDIKFVENKTITMHQDENGNCAIKSTNANDPEVKKGIVALTLQTEESIAKTHGKAVITLGNNLSFEQINEIADGIKGNEKIKLNIPDELKEKINKSAREGASEQKELATKLQKELKIEPPIPKPDDVATQAQRAASLFGPYPPPEITQSNRTVAKEQTTSTTPAADEAILQMAAVKRNESSPRSAATEQLGEGDVGGPEVTKEAVQNLINRGKALQQNGNYNDESDERIKLKDFIKRLNPINKSLEASTDVVKDEKQKTLFKEASDYISNLENPKEKSEKTQKPR